MIISILSAEFIKISRSQTLRILLMAVPFLAILFAFIVTYLFTAEKTISKRVLTLTEVWEGSLGILLLIWQFFAFLFSGLFIISWQYREHQADFFNRYRLLTFEFWQILLIRFVGFLLLYVSLLFVAYLLIFLFLPPFFFAFNPQFHFADFDWLPYIPYFFFSCLNQIFLLLPVFFLFSTKISHLALNILLLFGFIVLFRIEALPDWFFTHLHSFSKRMILTMFLPTSDGLFKMHELMELYGYSFVWTGLFSGVLVYFSRFFEPK